MIKKVLPFILILALIFMLSGEGLAQRRTVIRTEIIPLLVLHPNLMIERAIGNSLSLTLGAHVSRGGFGMGGSALLYLGGGAPRGLHIGPSIGFAPGGSFMLGLDGGYQWITHRGWAIRAGVTISWAHNKVMPGPLFGIGRAF